MIWALLVLAGLLEIGWAVGLKYTDGFTRVLPSIFTVCSMIASLALLSYCVRSLPLGSAYAVWTGIGVVGTIVFGIIIYGESVSAPRLLFLGLIVAGIVGLRLQHT